MKNRKYLLESQNSCFFHRWVLDDEKSNQFVKYFNCDKCESKKVVSKTNKFNYQIDFGWFYGLESNNE
jgi:hypothetical protein